MDPRILWRHSTVEADASATFDSAGILQLTWLFGNESSLAEIAEPNTSALRRAGMYRVNMGKMAQLKAADYASVAEGDCDDDNHGIRQSLLG